MMVTNEFKRTLWAAADHHFAPLAGRARCFFEAASLEALT